MYIRVRECKEPNWNLNSALYFYNPRTSHSYFLPISQHPHLWFSSPKFSFLVMECCFVIFRSFLIILCVSMYMGVLVCVLPICVGNSDSFQRLFLVSWLYSNRNSQCNMFEFTLFLFSVLFSIPHCNSKSVSPEFSVRLYNRRDQCHPAVAEVNNFRPQKTKLICHHVLQFSIFTS